jgi:DNA-directed RNA polymerase subunit RPC12/RpoP
MRLRCDYCQSECDQGAERCPSCGAPVNHLGVTALDYRRCPFCSRKLLALASPACSYCGRRLPQVYIASHEADLKRMDGVTSLSFRHQLGGESAMGQTSSDKEKKEPYGLLNILDSWDLLD